MKITDLDARFIGGYHVGNGTKEDPTHYREVDTLAEAQGVIFQCPKCAQGKEAGEEDGRRFVKGAHSVICWFREPARVPAVPPDTHPLPGRWNPAGTGLDDLTFVGPGNVSVLLSGAGCRWHGLVVNGDASILP